MNLSVEGWRVFDVLESSTAKGPKALWLKALPDEEYRCRPKYHDFTFDGYTLWYEALGGPLPDVADEVRR